MTDGERANALLGYGFEWAEKLMTYTEAHDYALRDIAAIRKECADRAESVAEHNGVGWIAPDLRAAIEGGQE